MRFHRGRLLDHVHLVVADLAASKRFYVAALGAGFTLEARLAGFRDLGGGANARFRRGLVALGVTWSR